MSPGCDFEPHKGEILAPRWSNFGSQGPPGSGPKYAHALKEGRGQQKERKGEWKRVKEGSEYASGQRPCEF